MSRKYRSDSYPWKFDFLKTSIFALKVSLLGQIFLSRTFPWGNYLRICSCLACVYPVMDARGKFGEHEKGVRFARGDSQVQF